MPSSYTPLLRLTLPADGELVGTWGQTVNNGITSLEESAIAGTAAVPMGDANQTLTVANGAADQARSAVLNATGALTAQRDITVPSSSKTYIVRNNTTGGFGVNVKTAAGTGTVVPAGTAMQVYCDGVNVMAATNSMVSLSTTGNVVLGDAAGDALTINSNTASIPNGITFNGGNARFSGSVGSGAVGGADGSFQLRRASDGVVVGAVSVNTAVPSVEISSGYETITFKGSSLERMRIDAAGNVGIGGLPSGFIAAGYTSRATFQAPSNAAINIKDVNGDWFLGTTAAALTFYSNTAGAERMRIGTAGHVFVNGVSGLGITGTSFHQVQGSYLAYGDAQGFRALNATANGAASFTAVAGLSGGGIVSGEGGPLAFAAGGTERMRIDAAGNLLVGITSAGSHQIFKSTTLDAGLTVLSVHATAQYSINICGVSAAGYAFANTALFVARDGTTSRSINAGGTINASGADYAEYEPCGDLVIAPGAVVGFKADGALTLTFSEAVRFGIKSTSPSYVGGDAWGTEEALGMKKPVEPVLQMPAYDGPPQPTEPVAPVEPAEGASDEERAAFEAAQAQYVEQMSVYYTEKDAWDEAQEAHRGACYDAEQAHAAALAQYEQDKAAFETALEAARKGVDRIAYSGKVPVNVMGATPGDYIVAVDDAGAIGGMAVTAPTFDQYRMAVGRVNKILADGRAEVAVIVH